MIIININTYAKLTPPPMFKPSEQTTFRLEYSDDLICNYATIKIYGYGLTVNGHTYGYDTVYTQTKYINTITAGQRYEDFTFDANTFGEDGSTWGVTGKMKAIIEISTTSGGTPFYKSNETLVDMVLIGNNPLYFNNLQESYNSSTVEVNLNYTIGRTCLGKKGQDEINSYQLFLYDNNDTLIQRSDVKYDFISEGYFVTNYSFYNLQNNATYKLKATATLVGGMEVETNTETFTTSFINYTLDTTHLILSNIKNEASIDIQINLSDITHTKYILSRSVKSSEDWITLYTKTHSSDTDKYTDVFPLGKVEYTYKLSVYNGTNLVETYYNNITHEFNGMCICDYNKSFYSQLDLNCFPISKNERIKPIEVIDSKYPYGLINGQSDYESGSIKGLFTCTLDGCLYNLDEDDVFLHGQNMLDFLNNGNVKLLKYSNGQAWLVIITGTPSLESGNDNILYVISFTWTECADATINSNYIKYGLIKGYSNS